MLNPQFISWTALLVAAGMAVQYPSVPVGSAAADDLDAYSAQVLHRHLAAELNDMFKNGQANQNISACKAYNEAMQALSDEGDDEDGDPSDDYIAMSELEEEMQEVDTDVSSVVAAAVGCELESEQTASGPSAHEPVSSMASTEAMLPRREATTQVRAKLARHIQASTPNTPQRRNPT